MDRSGVGSYYNQDIRQHHNYESSNRRQRYHPSRKPSLYESQYKESDVSLTLIDTNQKPAPFDIISLYEQNISYLLQNKN